MATTDTESPTDIIVIECPSPLTFKTSDGVYHTPDAKGQVRMMRLHADEILVHGAGFLRVDDKSDAAKAIRKGLADDTATAAAAATASGSAAAVPTGAAPAVTPTVLAPGV